MKIHTQPSAVNNPPSPRPYLAVTMGDPAGIGPEVVVKALASPLVWRLCRPIVIGSVPVFQREIRRLSSSLTVVPLPWDHGPVPAPSHGAKERHTFRRGHLPVLDPLHTPLGRFRAGRAGRASGAASIAFIQTAVQVAQAGCASAVVTAPINKEAIHLAGYAYPGHTELLAELTGSKRVGMMLVGGPLKILFATTHLPLRQVPRTLTVQRVSTAIQLAHQAMKDDFQVGRPRIGVAALNPHAGERGVLGHEEQEVIAPAVRMARRGNVQAAGPLPADTLFGAAVRGAYDVVVAMYHDQGLIPLKTVAFGRCVNLTVGLPIIRTSVDHGTAYDIAGTGQADPHSLLEAIKLARHLIDARGVD